MCRCPPTGSRTGHRGPSGSCADGPGAVSLSHVGQARTQGPPSTTSRRPRPTGYATWCWSGRAGRARPRSLEALLLSSGAINRAGSVTDGTTVSDVEEPEHAHQRSVSLAVAPLVHAGTKVNLLDTPGYADFAGEVRAGLRAADAALFVIAANDPIDGATWRLWRECADVGMPRAVVVTKLDHARADHDGVVAAARTAFGEEVRSVLVPVREGGAMTGGRPPARPGQRRRPPRRADRGDHRGVRGRGPHGPLPGRREGERGVAGRRPGDRDGDRLLPPGAPGLRHHRRGLHRAPRPGGGRLPRPRRAPVAGGLPADRQDRRPADLRPRRAAGGRGREDHQRPVRRPGQRGARLLGPAAPRPAAARVRPRLLVLRRRHRARGPRRRRAHRGAVVPLRPAPGDGDDAWSPATSAA